MDHARSVERGVVDSQRAKRAERREGLHFGAGEAPQDEKTLPYWGSSRFVVWVLHVL